MRVDEAPAAPAGRRGGTRAWIPLLLVGVYVGQCLWFIGTQSLTYDEPAHVMTGLDAWRFGRFDRWNDQPPLARLLLTLPLLPGGARWQVEKLGRIRPDPEMLAWYTRPVNVALGVALAALLWITARDRFGEGGANVALALFAFSPPLIAHYSVATVDGAATLLFFATAITIVRWRRQPSWAMTVWLGLVLGGFLASKFSAPPMALVALAVMIGHRRASDQLLVRVGKAACALTVALATVWAIYFFHTGQVTVRQGEMTGPYAGPGELVVPLPIAHPITITVPAPEYVVAFGGVVQHSVKGQPAFLLGRVRRSGGWRSYIPIVAALKWPPIVWATACAALVAFMFNRVPRSAHLAAMFLFPVVFFVMAVFSNLDIGDRYILLVYPFLLLVCAALWPAIAAWRGARTLIGVLIALQAADCLRYAPDDLSYFTPFVRPSQAYTLLTDSNLDWGQGLLALRAYEHAHPDGTIRLAYFGGVDPREYGIRAQPLAEQQRAAGTIVVSATHLSGQYLEDPAAYHWLLGHPRTAILNHTLHVFQVSAESAR